jgi:nicotinamidase-related amidase
MISPDQSLLVIIDVQGKLATLVHEPDSLSRHICQLIHAAKIFNIPIIHTEQVPEKLGTTIPAIAELLTAIPTISKRTFSCCGTPLFVQTINNCKRQQIILAGIETHVCVYQTACDLISQSYSTYVVADAVSSRTVSDKTLGLERMSSLGGNIVSTEMLICEWTQSVDHPRFREIMALIK